LVPGILLDFLREFLKRKKGPAPEQALDVVCFFSLMKEGSG
jgi:hypothetical protein